LHDQAGGLAGAPLDVALSYNLLSDTDSSTSAWDPEDSVFHTYLVLDWLEAAVSQAVEDIWA
jgi:hypothetical protein